MKIFLGVISVVLLASVVRANFMLGVLPAVYKCGQQNAGKASIGDIINVSGILDKLGVKCAINPAPGLGGMLLCSGTKVLELVAEVEKSLLTNPDPKALVAPSSTVYELLTALLDIQGTASCVVKDVVCSGMKPIPPIGDTLCTVLSLIIDLQ